MRIFFGATSRQHSSIEPQQLGQRPGLKRATARRVRRLRIGDLGNMAETGALDMLEYRREKALTSFELRVSAPAVDAHPGLDEAPGEPRPDGSLMITAVALSHAAIILRRVSRLFGRQRAQPHRRPQAPHDRVDDSAGLFSFDERDWKSDDAEDLNWH